MRKQVVDEALKLLGYDCRNHPADDENHLIGCLPQTGFDCSGFVIYVLRQAQIPIQEDLRHSSEFFDRFGVFVHIYRPGDLVFFTKDGRAPKHIGIIVNNDEYIHSPGKNGTKVSIAKIKKESLPFLHDDQIYLENPIGFKAPAIVSGRWQQII